MNRESSPVPASDGMEKMLATFASAHPEYKDLSVEELHQAADLIRAQEEGVSDEKTLKDALDARLAVRNVGVPVTNLRGEVIAMADSPEQVGKIYREDQVNRRGLQ